MGKREINMDKKKYYAIKASMTFEKTILVPVDSVEDLDGAIERIDDALETCEVLLMEEEADFEIKPSKYADKNGMYELTDEQARLYQIVEGYEEE